MCGQCGCEPATTETRMKPEAPVRTISVEENIHQDNDRRAENLRRRLGERGTLVINLMSSPGSGKTTLLEETLKRSGGEASVIVGDLQTDQDAQRLRPYAASVRQINTVHACHLDATMIEEELQQIAPAPLLFIENIGNLVCPASFDLGEHLRVALLSVCEGEDKPLKYPLLFHTADLVLVTKSDLIPHLDFDPELLRVNLEKVRPGRSKDVLMVSARTGEGMDAWMSRITGQVELIRRSR